MSRSGRAVLAFIVLMPGVVGGWAAWQAAYPTLEPALVTQLGGAGGALALWGLLGTALAAGYALAQWAGTRFIGLGGPCGAG